MNVVSLRYSVVTIVIRLKIATVEVLNSSALEKMFFLLSFNIICLCHAVAIIVMRLKIATVGECY